MPSIMSLTDGTSVLSLELGICSGTPLGSEVLSCAPSERTATIDRLRAAIGHLATSTEASEIRRWVEVAYAEDVAGAPPDFPFGPEPDGSILAKLARLEDDPLRGFCQWSVERVAEIKENIKRYTPELCDLVVQRVGRLVGVGLLPKPALGMAEEAMANTRRQGIGAHDSFDRGLAYGTTTTDSRGIISLSHLFTGGFFLGEPDDRFRLVGGHEGTHSILRQAGVGFLAGIATTPPTIQGRAPYVMAAEEAVLAHMAAVTDPKNGLSPEASMYEARKPGLYNALRGLIGVMCERGRNPIGPDLLGEALVAPMDVKPTARTTVEKLLLENARYLLPRMSKDGNPFWEILADYGALGPTQREGYLTRMTEIILKNS